MSRPTLKVEIGFGLIVPFDISGPTGIAITPDGKTAYVSTGSDPVTIVPVDLSTNTVGDPITAQGVAIAITPDGATAYAVEALRYVIPIDTATNTAGTAIDLGSSATPSSIAITPDGATAYVTNEHTAGTVIPIDTATNTAGTAISVGKDPLGIAITPDGATAYVCNFGDDTVSPIDLSSGTAGTAISVGSEPHAIAITPDGTTAYVCNVGDDTVSPIDLATATAGTAIDVGSQPFDIAITPDGATAYVTNAADDTVSPIDIATNVAGDVISVGDQPLHIAINPAGTMAYVGNNSGNTVTPLLVGLTDVSQYVSGQITTNRGRSRETDQYQAGTATFTLRNESRDFDPANTDSPYYAGIVPGIPVKIWLDDVQIFGGEIDDISVDYEMPDTSTVEFDCTDGFVRLATASIFSYPATQQTSGLRIADILTEVDYPWPSDCDDGRSTLQAKTLDNIFALDHIQSCARSENGFCFVSRDGILTFYDRYHVSGETSQATFSDLGDSGDIKYRAIKQKSQALLLINRVSGTRDADSATQKTANDPTSQKQYGVRALTLSSLENLSDSDVDDLCYYIVGRYSNPDQRFDQVALELTSFDETRRQALTALDLVDLVTVKRTPPGTGSPSTISKLSIIDGVAFSGNASSGSFQMTLQLGSVDTRKFFKLDDAVFGKLDSGNKLNF